MKHRQTLWIPAWTLLVALPFLLVAGTAAQTLTLVKELGPGQGASALPGEEVRFQITLDNSDINVPILDHFMEDTVPACFEPFTDCDDVSCTGGIDCGECEVTANGFRFDGLSLSAASGSQETMIFHVTLTAGPDPVDCTNVASSVDPGSSDPISDDETISIIGGITFTKSLAAGQSSTVAPGGPVVFEIEMINEGGTRMNQPLTDDLDECFETIDCDDVDCVGGLSCGVCDEYPEPDNGFDNHGIDLAAAGQPGDRVTLTVNATAGMDSGECCNLAITIDPLDGSPLFEDECVSIVSDGPQLLLFKVLASGQSPTVAPGEPVVFRIILYNNSDQMIAGGPIVDTLDPCFETISCFDVACTGDCGTCSETADGFEIDSFALDPSGLASIYVEATAGQTPGACTNTVRTVEPGSGGDISDDETITIEESADMVFSDDFESGDTTAWSETVP